MGRFQRGECAGSEQASVYVRTGKGDFYDGVNFRYQPYWAPMEASPGPPLQTVRDGRMADRLIDTDYRDFAPRLGIAYSPRTGGRYGPALAFSSRRRARNSIFDMNRGLGGRTGQVSPTTYGQPTFGYTNFINTAALPVTLPVGLTWGADPRLPTTYTMQYLLNVQRTLGKATTLEVGYNGSLGRHLADLINMNQPVPGTASAVSRLPILNLGRRGSSFCMRRHIELQRRQRQAEPAFRTDCPPWWPTRIPSPWTTAAPSADRGTTSRRRTPSAAPCVRKRPLGFQRQASFRHVHPLHAAIRQRPEVSQHGAVVDEWRRWQLSTITRFKVAWRRRRLHGMRPGSISCRPAPV